MQRVFTGLLLFFFSFSFSQNKVPYPEFEPGQLIIKLKDDVKADIVYGNKPGSGVDKNSINEDIAELLGIDVEIKNQELLFSIKTVERSIVVKNELIKEYNDLNNIPATQQAPGSTSSDDNDMFFSLKNVIKLEFEDPSTNIHQIIDQLKDNLKVDYAEPNYIYSINDYTIESDIIYDNDLKTSTTTSLTTPSDPLYDQQPGITKTNIDDVWTDYGTGDGSQVVAVLDTGVDYTHPDLEANIWINTAEQNGVEGVDDDGNGYIDDIRGWDFFNEDNAPLDDNMHGTHVAGIIGAVGNNDIGIAGAAWNVKIMPLKVFQASGRAGTNDIVQGLEYAIANNATVINMSFSSISPSTLIRSTLETAYLDRIVLVAATGNDGIAIGPCFGCRPYYPAAYRWVIGVEDFDGSYDNYDQDGPIFSRYPDNLTYELQSFGSAIMSTVPDGGYRSLTGTSMAAPLISGSMSLYNLYRDDKEENQDMRIARVVNSTTNTDGFFDLKYAIENEELNPILRLTNINYSDKTSTNEHINNIIDAGEKIEIDVSVVNWFGPSGNIEMKLEFGGNELQNNYFASKVTIVDNKVEMNPLGAYGKRRTSSDTDNFSIEIVDDVIHDTEILIKISLWDVDRPNAIFELEDSFKITNQLRLPSYIDSDYTVEEGEYLIDSPVVIDAANLIVSPGVTFRIIPNDNYSGNLLGLNLRNDAKIYANGTKEKKIRWFKEGRSDRHLKIQQADWNVVEGFNGQTWRTEYYEYLKNSELRNNGNGEVTIENDVTNTYFENVNFGGYIRSFFEHATVKGMNLVNERSDAGTIYRLSSNKDVFNNGKKEINFIHGTSYGGQTYLSGRITIPMSNTSNLNYEVPDLFSNILDNELLQDSRLLDFYDDPNLGIVKLNSFKKTPYDSAPGFLYDLKINDRRALYLSGPIWVNGQKLELPYDSDIFHTDDVSLGEYKFDLYFNREMDTSINPKIGYGLADPYLQNAISESGTWSSDGKIYTVNHDFNIGTSDGYNKIYVYGAKDLNGFEIPRSYIYHFKLSTAGSASTGFAATPGLGEIALEWTAPSESDLADVLGYNMYRYTANSDGTFTDPVKINESLITDLNYKDYNVVRAVDYYYKYKVLKTNFTETDYSTTVTTQLLTADLGDSNGDSSVNVLDVVNTVDHILGNNPKPFIDYATDVNNDSNINVLDVVGIVDLILKTGANGGGGNGFKTSSNGVDYYRSDAVGKATFYWRGNDLYVESDYDIGAMQLVFDKDFKYVVSDDLSRYEKLDFEQDGKKVFMFYSFSGSSAGKNLKLLTRLDKVENPIDIDKAVVSTPNALKLTPVFGDDELPDVDAPEQGDEFKLVSISPNPSNGKIQVNYYLPEQMDKVVVRLYNQIGQLIWSSEDFNNNSGYSNEEVNVVGVPQGAYIVTMDAIQSGQIKGYQFKRLIIN